MTTKLTPMNDLLFKKIFASPGNEDILIGLIKDLLNIPVDSLKILTPYNIESIKQEMALIEENQDDTLSNNMSYTEADLKVQTSNNQVITIEVQRYNMQGFFNRTFIYALDAHRNHLNLNSQVNYLNNLKTYGLNIIDFNLFDPDSPALNRITLFEEELKLNVINMLKGNLTQSITLAYFSLINHHLDPDTNVSYWQQFFKGEEVPPQAPNYIYRAQMLIDIENLSKEEFDMATLKEKYELDRQAQLDYATEVGVEKGIDIGKAKGKAEGKAEGLEEGIDIGVAKILYLMYQSGSSVEDMAKKCHMHVEDVEHYINMAKQMDK